MRARSSFRRRQWWRTPRVGSFGSRFEERVLRRVALRGCWSSCESERKLEVGTKNPREYRVDLSWQRGREATDSGSGQTPEVATGCLTHRFGGEEGGFVNSVRGRLSGEAAFGLRDG